MEHKVWVITTACSSWTLKFARRVDSGIALQSWVEQTGLEISNVLFYFGLDEEPVW